MAGLNNFWKHILIEPNNFKFLFNANRKMSTDHYEFTIQDALRDSKLAEEPTQKKDTIIKKGYKRVPIVKENGSEKEDKKQASRGERELARKQEAEKIEKASTYGKEKSILQDIKAGHLPLREAVILSEIIGAPRCKSRYKRRR